MSGVVRLRQRAPSEPALSDEALARACAAGDPGAVAALFDRFHHGVARYIRRLGAGSEVEDLLQSTFIEVARGSATYDETRGGVLTWLLGIATNVVRHHRRSAARRHRLRAAFAFARPNVSSELDEQAEARVQLERAHEALSNLREEQREAFVLCVLEGVSAREAAQVLGASEVAVWKRVSKARKQLRRAVQGGIS